MIRNIEINECKKIKEWLTQNDYSIMDCLGAIILKMKSYGITNWHREIIVDEETYKVEIIKVQK